MTLAQAVVSTDTLLGFLSGFGEGVNDLLCQIKEMTIHGAVDVDTHYCSKSMPVLLDNEVTYRVGDVYIPHLDKVCAFLKAAKEPKTVIRHVGGTFSLKNGNDEFSTPTYTEILSHQSVARAQMAVASAVQNGWSKLGRAEMTCHGTLVMNELHGLEAMMKVTAKDSPVRIIVDEDEMTVSAGSSLGARMSRRIEVDCHESSAVETVFSSALPKLLRMMGSGNVEFHIGNRSAFVLVHQEVDTTLILKHQEGVDQ